MPTGSRDAPRRRGAVSPRKGEHALPIGAPLGATERVAANAALLGGGMRPMAAVRDAALAIGYNLDATNVALLPP